MNKEAANKVFVLQNNLSTVKDELRKVKSALELLSAENKAAKIVVVAQHKRTGDYEFWITDDRIKNILTEEKEKHEKMIEKINSEIESL